MRTTIHRNLHTDFSIFEQNKLPPRSYFIPFSGLEALQGTDYKKERASSDRVTLLSGEWEFAYFDKLSKVPEPLDTEKQRFDKIQVPSTWQRTSYDQIAYINTRYPFPKRPPKIPYDVAVGLYRKKVTFPAAFEQHILTFLGIAGAAAIYMNGNYVGYSEGSHNTAEFDITPFLMDGDNELLVAVYKWSNGTYLECQDMFRENGIFRDVYITSSQQSSVMDFSIKTVKEPDGGYCLELDVSGRFEDGTHLHVSAQDSEGKLLFEAQLLPQTHMVIPHLKVREWSAETPHMYQTVFRLTDGGGRELEAIRTYIGFKEVHINGEVFLFNGKAIKMKGVNHHDTHMTKGYAMSVEDMEKDVILMKEFNCNTVRTSHYPPDPLFLTMCDMYGLYVVDEADIETHGFYSVPGTYRPGRLSNDPKWASHYLDRVKRMYERDKNHPSITMWSLGNESGGYRCQDVCYQFLKEANPQIPVHYEGVNRSKRWAYDVVSHMYASPGLMRKVLEGKAGEKYKGKPFFQCEYAHAMGNGPGGLEEYMQLFYSSDQFMGGCIWEWADHSVYDKNAKYQWTYGGDHNEPIHDGNFCVDGLFYPDRRPSSGAYEMKTVYRPVRAAYQGNGCVELWNTRSFAGTLDLLIHWELLVNGESRKAGELTPDIPAGGRQVFTIESEYINTADKDVLINLSYFDKQTGHNIAVEQLTVRLAGLPETSLRNTAKIKKDRTSITVTFQNGGARFLKRKGLVSYQKNGEECLLSQPLDGQCGFIPHIYRGRLDNDQYLKIYWNILGLEQAKARLTSCTVKKDGTGEYIRTVYHLVTRGFFILARASVDYRFDDNGTVEVSSKLTKVCPATASLPRFGVHAELQSRLHEVGYYGRGPLENYSDFKEHAPLGVYQTTVDQMAHKYIKPQDSGNRGDVRYASLSDTNGNQLIFTAKKRYLNFNVTPFTLQQLIKAKHIEDLPDRDVVFTSLDGFVRGTGSGSCGPAPSPEHRIAFGYFKPLTFTFTMELNDNKK